MGSNKSAKITHNLVSKDARMPGLISLRERQHFIIKHIEFVALKQASSQSKSIVCFLTDQRTGAQWTKIKEIYILHSWKLFRMQWIDFAFLGNRTPFFWIQRMPKITTKMNNTVVTWRFISTLCFPDRSEIEIFAM